MSSKHKLTARLRAKLSRLVLINSPFEKRWKFRAPARMNDCSIHVTFDGRRLVNSKMKVGLKLPFGLLVSDAC